MRSPICEKKEIISAKYIEFKIRFKSEKKIRVTIKDNMKDPNTPA